MSKAAARPVALPLLQPHLAEDSLNRKNREEFNIKNSSQTKPKEIKKRANCASITQCSKV
jgi:hypothetical protein